MMKTAQISPISMRDIQTPDLLNKIEASAVSGLNRGIVRPIVVVISINIASEAIKLHKMGYLSRETLLEAGVDIKSLMAQNQAEYNQVQKKAIQDAIAEQFGYTAEQLATKSRKKEAAFARHLSMYLLCKNTNLGLKAIGEMYGGRDHTTALHGRDRIADSLTSKGHNEEKNCILSFLSKHTFQA